MPRSGPRARGHAAARRSAAGSSHPTAAASCPNCRSRMRLPSPPINPAGPRNLFRHTCAIRRGGCARNRGKEIPSASSSSAQRLERRPEFLSENLRLLPRGEVAPFVDLVVVVEVGIGLLRPAPRGLILLSRKDGYGHRNLDASGVEEAALVFPIETGRRDPRVRQPVKSDVVEDLVTRQFACSARGAVQCCNERGRRLAV